MASSGPHILVLAAGMGTRMKSATPKVLHDVLAQPMLHHVLAAAEAIPRASLHVVCPPGGGPLVDWCRERSIGVLIQESPRGTGDAVDCARGALANERGALLVLNGDVVMLRKETVSAFWETHASGKASATVLTARVPRPFGYGRILRDANGGFRAIREERDCSEDERRIDEINCGVYLFDIGLLFEKLAKLSTANAQGERYLTDVLGLLHADGKPIETHALSDPDEALGINTREELARVEALFQARVNREWMLNGVTIRRPESVAIDCASVLAGDVEIEGDVRIVRSRVDAGARIESGCRIVDSEIGPGAHVKQGCYLEKSVVGRETVVGPYAHLRPGTRLGERVKIGNFVEVKKSVVGDGSKASHLSYIGDAEIGRDVNIGCGFITCNYDGKRKHKTVIEDEVFIGSDSQTVAPVTVGRGAYVASGTTLTKSVPPDALALARAPQKNKAGYAKRIRARQGDK